MSTKTLLTADEYMATSDDGWSELVRGEVVELSPPGAPHGFVCSNIARIIANWAVDAKSGYTFSNDTAVQTESDPDTVRGADVMYVSKDRLPNGIPTGRITIAPNLCVEVLSPTDRWADVLVKIGEYLHLGVDEVWIVDPEERWVERHRPDEPSRRFTGDEELADSPALPGFAVRVSEFFVGI